VAQRWLDEEQQRTWRTWLTVTELLPRALDAQLQRDAGLTHAAYVVLAMLSEAPGRSRRMTDLARRANQSQSRLSHTVARLEERGWVRRERSAEDGRGNVAVLTDAGWDVVRSVAPGHVEAVRRDQQLPPRVAAAPGEEGQRLLVLILPRGLGDIAGDDAEPNALLPAQLLAGLIDRLVEAPGEGIQVLAFEAAMGAKVEVGEVEGQKGPAHSYWEHARGCSPGKGSRGGVVAYHLPDRGPMV